MMNKNEIEKRAKEILQDKFELYKSKAEEHINSLDFNKLETIKSKNIDEITQNELEYLGFVRIKNDELDELYYFSDFDGLKIYFNRIQGGFEKRGFRLKKELEIKTTSELLENSLTDWKLKMNQQQHNIDFNWDKEPPF
jgi:hypothetical protein